MARTWLGTVVLLVLAACGAPPPTGVLTPSARPSIDASPAAAVAGLPREQLVPIEEGFVAAHFDAAGSLQLLWIRPTASSFEPVVLVTIDEQRVTNTSRISTNPVVCPADVGLTRTRFVIGQATDHDALQMSGADAAGGRVVDGAYVFAVGPGDAEIGWSLVGQGGEQIASADPAWLSAEPDAARVGELCSAVAGH